VLTDPQSVVYDGDTFSLPRTEEGEGTGRYTSSTGEFEILISNSPQSDGRVRVEIQLSRTNPDPTPMDVFDPYRRMPSSVSLSWTRFPYGDFADELGFLQTALLELVDDPYRDRLLAFEK
jgi:hypothetical protein